MPRDPKTILIALCLYAQHKENLEEMREDLKPYIPEEILDLSGEEISKRISEAILHQQE